MAKKLDEVIDAIAFGGGAPKPASCLGLYLSPEMIYLAESRRERDGRFVVDHLVRIPIPSQGKGPGITATMNTDFLADPKKIADVVRQSMSQLRWNSKNVRVTLSHHLGLLRYFSMPAMDRRFLASAVPLEAKKYIPIPFDMLAHDFQVVPLPPDAGGKLRFGVLIAVTQKKNIANVSGFLDALGLHLDGLEVAPCSVLRLWQTVDPAPDPAPFTHVHFDGGNIRIMVIDQGMPVFFREVFLNAPAEPADLRKIDLPGCLSFVQKQLGLTSLSRVRVSGQLPNLAVLRDAFARETGLPAAIQDTPRLLSVKGGDWGGYSALGASAHLLVKTPLTLDLGVIGRVSDEERRTARDILLLGGGLALLLAARGLFKQATYSYGARELHKYQRQIDPDVAAALQGMDSGAIETQIRDMQSQLGELKAAAGADRPKTSLVLKEIVAAMPEKVWLDHLTILQPLMGADKQPLEVTLRGHAQDRAVGEEQALAYRFEKNLHDAPTIGKRFEIQIGVQKQPGGEEIPARGLDPKALAEKLEDRTRFTVTMRAKR